MTDELDHSGDLVSKLLGVMEELYHLKDLDALLDQVLLQARRLTNADAGSILTIENQVLNFSYIHNDTLFGARTAAANISIPAIPCPSMTNPWPATWPSPAKPLIIDDAYQLPPALPFTFNKSFDEQSGYRTQIDPGACP